MRGQLQALIKADEATRLKHVQELYRRIHSLTGNAAIVGLAPLAHMADALEALLKELFEKPQNVNSSALRTVATTIDFLGILFERGIAHDDEKIASASILVVDDEAISLRAISHSLEKARLK